MTRNAFVTFRFTLCIPSAPVTLNALFANYNLSCLRIYFLASNMKVPNSKKDFLILLLEHLDRSTVT